MTVLSKSPPFWSLTWLVKRCLNGTLSPLLDLGREQSHDIGINSSLTPHSAGHGSLFTVWRRLFCDDHPQYIKLMQPTQESEHSHVWMQCTASLLLSLVDLCFSFGIRCKHWLIDSFPVRPSRCPSSLTPFSDYLICSRSLYSRRGGESIAGYTTKKYYNHRLW